MNIDRLKKIRALVDTPLVLHGTSGISDAVVKECIANGICKVNYATDLRIAFTHGANRILKDKAVYDPKKYMAEGRNAVKEYAAARLIACGSNRV